jgi:hypothetical protein
LTPGSVGAVLSTGGIDSDAQPKLALASNKTSNQTLPQPFLFAAIAALLQNR